MARVLLGIGLRRRYRPIAEDCGNHWGIALEARRPAKIVDGDLQGTEADVYDPKTVRVWSGKVGLGHRLIKEGLRGYSRNGECEVFIPVERGDELIPKFGVKTRREVTEAQRERGRRLLESLKRSKTLGK